MAVQPSQESRNVDGSIPGAEQWSPDWSNAVFSLDERDRRWARVRQLMARDGVDLIVCLPCTNSHDRGQADPRYLTQLGENSDETTVTFPVEGDVTAWHSRGGVWPSSNWLTDIRAAGRGTGGATIVKWLNEHPALQAGTIAIAALDSSPIAHVRAEEGEVNWRSVEIIRQAFPSARLVSATPILGEARWQKSAEEIEFLRKGTEIAEVTLNALLTSAREGIRERHVFAQMMFANADAGGSFQPMFGWVSGPQGHPYHRLEQPSFRTLKRGDMIGVEVEGRWAGYVSQIDETVAIGETTPEVSEAMKLAFEAFNRVVEKMVPGTTMAELIEAANISSLGGRAQAGLGMHGRGTGDDGPLLVSARRETQDVLDLPLSEGCCFAVKPSVRVDGPNEYARWGDCVLVTRQGGQRLGTRPQEHPILV